MTIDDESSVYVGGLPYDATEDSVRNVFELYGSVIAVKIINDASTRGKCYGFVTFRNPRSAIHAIHEMDGRTVDGRVIRVNEVRSRGERISFSRDREGFRRNVDRGRNWVRDRDHDRDYDHDGYRDHERDYDHDRDRYRDRYSDRLSREHERARSLEDDQERDRGYERARDYDQVRDHFLDRDHHEDRDLEDDERGQSRHRDQGWERDHRALESGRDGEMEKTENHNDIAVKDRDQPSRRRNDSNSVDRQSREFLSPPSVDCNDQVKEQLVRKREEIKMETIQMEESLEEKGKLVLDLQKKSKKLEDALINTKKNSSRHKKKLTKLHKSFMQVKDYRERIKSIEHELQSIADTDMVEGGSDDVGLRGGILTNGHA